ncbi:MAG: hypothetical protein M1834_008713 [Cirrosporium novae-zelandiae]|nr:MAG: hypothetical protein M1834_008713 [Cirrosporium novae-zelandiae]
MAHFLRGKQVGIQNDLSAGLHPELFVLDDFARYGINSQVGTLAYDPVQSLLAIGTKDTQFGPGKIYVFGQKRVCVTFELQRRASVQTLQFCAEKLICIDSKNDISIFSLQTRELLASYAPPGLITAFVTDLTLDYAFIGLQTGDIVAYDLDRETLTPYKISNLWWELNPKARISPVLSLAFHPKDLGKLLIGYGEGAITYTFKHNKSQSIFKNVGKPRLIQALFHPTGTFVLTIHEDSNLVVWDPKDGRIITARTVQDIANAVVGVNQPLSKVAWCSKENPDDTGILVAGGLLSTSSVRYLTFLDLGPTPIYATSSWQILSEHFEKPKRQIKLPLPDNADVVDFCLIPRSSPHYVGANDPIAVICVLSSGELITLSFPSGHQITPTNQLHVSLSFVHPFAGQMALANIDRTRWLGMTEKRSHGPLILKGGAETRHPLKRFEKRNVTLISHADGTIRLWDAGHDDEIENESVLQVDVARAASLTDGVFVTQMSLSGSTGELAVGLKSGEVTIFKWGINHNHEQDLPLKENDGPGNITNIVDRADSSLKEGLLPFILFNQQRGSVTALKMSDVGFIAAGYENGGLDIIDMRGPTIIFSAKVEDCAKQQSKRGSLIRSSSRAGHSKPEWPTCIEFGVMSLEGDSFSSIICFVGTNLGRVASFKLLPRQEGGYSAQFAGVMAFDDRVISISPINADTGAAAPANPELVSGLTSGLKIRGVVVAVTPNSAYIFKPASVKGAHKSFDDYLCDCAAVARFEDQGYALVGLFGDGCARAFSLPALKELGSAKINHILDIKRFSESIITGSGDIFGWVGPSEMAILNAWGTGRALPQSQDQLFNEEALIPPRPTISNLQWISGTQFVSASDMDLLIGGPDRPPSKRMLAQMRAEEQQRRAASRNPQASSSAAVDKQEEGYWASMQRQLQERTEKLGLATDSMDRLEENSSGFADDVSKFVGKQKKNIMMGGYSHGAWERKRLPKEETKVIDETSEFSQECCRIGVLEF